MGDVVVLVTTGLRIACLFEAVECGGGSAAMTILVCIVPVLRLLKTLRHFKQFHLFLRLLTTTGEAISLLLLFLCIIVLVFSSIVYTVEPRGDVASLPHAMYFIIVT